MGMYVPRNECVLKVLNHRVPSFETTTTTTTTTTTITTTTNDDDDGGGKDTFYRWFVGSLVRAFGRPSVRAFVCLFMGSVVGSLVCWIALLTSS